MTPHTFAVLRLLADGTFQSGEAIGQRLGVTRETVSSALENVEQLGLGLERVRGRGYRLLTPVGWLDAAEISRCLGRYAGTFAIEVVEQTGSTNDDVIVRAAGDAPSGLVRVAEMQTSGRGRLQRGWHSGLGGALTFSLLWHFPQGAASLSGLSLATGVSVVRTLRRLGALDVMLKWPNDVLWRHMKLGGILIELAGDARGPARAVIGIGLNVRLPEAITARIDQPVTDLAHAGVDADRNRLLGELLCDLGDVLALFSQQGFAPFKSEWERAHVYQDKMVRLRMPDNSEQEGRVVGVDNDGALVVATPSGRRRFHGGELQLRPVTR